MCARPESALPNADRFAMDKVESGSLRDPDGLEALVSNLYAAYQYCVDPIAAGQLHDLWNALIAEPEPYIDNEDSLSETLQMIASSL